MQTSTNTKAALLYISPDTFAFLPLEIHGLHGLKLEPPTYRELPETPKISVANVKTTSMGAKIPIEKLETVSPEASYLVEAHAIRSSNAKARIAWAMKVEQEIAPQILRRLGFTNIQPGNGRPVDIEAWYNRTRYLVDVKYLAQMPSIIRKLATLIMNLPPAEITVSRVRRRKSKEPA